MEYKSLIKIALDYKDKFEDIKQLVEELDLKIIYTDFESKFKGVNIDNIIIINKDLDKKYRDFVIAHEVAHYLFHDDNLRAFTKFELLKGSKEEFQANLFATVFLGYEYKDNIDNCPIQKIVNYIYSNYLVNYIDYKKIV